ncbi:MAG: GspE/PulE family protein, partial [Armatimonadota bacterium]
MQKKSIGETFIGAGLITEDQLSQAVEKQRQLGGRDTIADVLVSMGLITDRDRAKCLGMQWGVQYVDLSEHELEGDIVRRVSQDIARRYKLVPISGNNGTLTVAMKNPLDVFAIDEVRLITGSDVEPVIATEEDILHAISSQYGNGSGTTEAVCELLDNIQTTELAINQAETRDDEVSIEELRELSEEAPVVRLASLILTKGIQEGCSDIHLEPGRTSLRVRYRIDGVMHEGLAVPRKVQASLASRIKIMADMDIAEKRAPQDGRISATVDGKQYDFRVSTLPNIYGEKVVLRVLDKSSIMIGLNKLGFLPQNLEMFESIIARTYGIILVTGPTGSGKSTTLYSVLSKLNSGEKNILTIEDPVEYELPGITQTQVNPRAGLTFATGLRTILRQDPDIIMIGEIRDQETAQIAVEAALTGHLVLSTLHTNDAPGAIT